MGGTPVAAEHFMATSAKLCIEIRVLESQLAVERCFLSKVFHKPSFVRGLRSSLKYVFLHFLQRPQYICKTMLIVGIFTLQPQQ